METTMLQIVPKTPPPAEVRSHCPDCQGELAILRIIPGRGGSEYWTMRCTDCGGVHLDIVKARKEHAAPQPAQDTANS
jgi:uncharacterized Zn finger protein